MELGILESQIDQLVESLRAFHGFRSIWLGMGAGGAPELWHAEPDDDLEGPGCRLVATLMQPSHEVLTAALLPALPLDGHARSRLAGWNNPDLDGVGLIAACAG
ncbi:MAG: hypothetical protein EHM50_11485 [Lysobacterales bacterium]|nr:MAG: hypothetical protein EHM50_11485 [Xanthomonadales bacterium]